MVGLEALVKIWAEDKGIMNTGTVAGQLGKLYEEFQELEEAVEFEDMDEIVDAIGDMQVVLIILAAMYGLSAKDCLAKAYDVISKREGRMVNGVFVKDE